MYFQDTHSPQNAKNIFKIDQFYKDLQGDENDFPSFVFLQPSMNVHGGQRPTWQHPDASVREGERFIKVTRRVEGEEGERGQRPPYFI